MVLDTTLLNTQHYKVRFKGKVEQSWEWSSALTLHLGVVAIEKGAFGSPSTMVANLLTYEENDIETDSLTKAAEKIKNNVKTPIWSVEKKKLFFANTKLVVKLLM